MPITVKDLMQSRQELALITSQYDESAQTALEKMRENNFSQLPVLGRDYKLLGIITNNHILNALQTFEIPLSQLKVSHATDNKVSVCREDNELSDVFADVKRYESVVIQSKEGQKLIGIITTFDILEFYSQRAENLILLKNIETVLKDHIKCAFTGKEVELREAIDNVYNRTNQKFEQFKKALKHYKNIENEKKDKDEEIITEVFERHFVDNNKSTTLDELSLDNFIKLLLNPINSDYCKFIFNDLEGEAIKKLLVSVRNIRNALFHFRREIISDDHKKLRFCSDWLTRHPAYNPESQHENIEEQNNQDTELQDSANFLTSSDFIEGVKQTEDGNYQNDSRYLKLAEELNKLSRERRERINYRFKDIEKILGNTLPKAAREDRSWWSDDDTQPWVRAGWNVLSINIIEEVVTFIYSPHRKKYIEFFQLLLEELSEKASFRVRFPYQDGRHYITVATISDKEAPVANLAYSFTEFRKKFRVELFIDKNDQSKNQKIYECLKSHEKEIESELGKLMWEFMETKPQSRISLVYENEILISDSKDELLKLKEWAVKTMLKFQKVMNEYVSKCSF